MPVPAIIVVIGTNTVPVHRFLERGNHTIDIG
jgi:hypothetical protein